MPILQQLSVTSSFFYSTGIGFLVSILKSLRQSIFSFIITCFVEYIRLIVSIEHSRHLFGAKYPIFSNILYEMSRIWC
jgi:hypothetical protein